MIPFLRYIADYLLFSNIFIALCAFALVQADKVTLGIENTDLKLPFFVAAATLFSYNLHRFIDLKQAKEKSYGHILKWTHSKIPWLYIFVVVPLLICLYLVFSFNLKVLFSLLILGLITVFYSIPLKLGGKTWRLRDIGISKIFWVSLVWCISTVVLTYFNYYEEVIYSPSHVLALTIQRFLFILCITIPFDIRDIRYDKKERLQTIATRLGTKKAQQLAVIILVVLSTINILNWNLLIALFYIFIIPLILLANSKRNDYYYTGLIDGTMVVYAIIVICTS